MADLNHYISAQLLLESEAQHELLIAKMEMKGGGGGSIILALIR